MNIFMQWLLTFYNLSKRYTDQVNSASQGAALYVANGALNVKTGKAADQMLDGNVENGTLSINITQNE